MHGGLGQPAGPAGEPGRDDRRGLRRTCVGQRRRRRLGLRAPAPVLGRQRHGPGGILGELVTGDAHSVVGQLDRRPLRGHEHRGDRHAGLALRHLADRPRHVDGVGDQRRDEDGQDRVAGVELDQRLQRAAVLIGRRGGDHVDRVARRGAGGQELQQAPLDLAGQLGHVDPVGLAGVGTHDPRAPGIGDDGHPVAARQRLRGQQRSHGEQLVQGVGADHPGLGEQRIDGDIGSRQQRAGVRRGRACPRARAPALDRQQRLVTGKAARDAGELARIAERLQVQQSDLGARRPAPSSRACRCPTGRPCCPPRRMTTDRCPDGWRPR